MGGKFAVGVLDAFLVRFNANGTLDTSYGNGGLANLSSISAMSIEDMELTPDGKVLAAMQVSGSVQFRAMRVNTNGTLDSLFGSGGVRTFSGINSNAAAIEVLPDRRFLLLGDQFSGGTLIRSSATGVQDTSFGASGQQIVDFGTNTAEINLLEVAPDGKIVVGGYGSNGLNTTNFAVARLNADGTFDTSFDTDGKTTTDMLTGERDFATSAQVQADGKILLVGYSVPASGDNEIAIAQYNVDGTLDTTFDTDGKFQYSGSSFAAQRSFGSVLQLDGKLLVLSGWSFDFRIARIAVGLTEIQGSDTVDVTDDDVVPSVLNSLVFNEVLPDPTITGGGFDTDGDGTPETADEFVEIYNTSLDTLNIGGLQFWDSGSGNYFTIPGGTNLGPNGFVTVVADVAGVHFRPLHREVMRTLPVVPCPSATPVTT